MSARLTIIASLQRAGHSEAEARELLNAAYKEPHADVPDPDFRESLPGGHALVVEFGDCEFHGSCQCGKPLGTIRQNQSIDRFGGQWERHCMTEVADR
ncbi:hypothetical protein [Streptomyces sp. NPDC096153]|uniref:hypothetical protein n=1 Tax=Streptomyces sp. NPDC096153 TaxID=3155548 RepID=UPI003322C85A